MCLTYTLVEHRVSQKSRVTHKCGIDSFNVINPTVYVLLSVPAVSGSIYYVASRH